MNNLQSLHEAITECPRNLTFGKFRNGMCMKDPVANNPREVGPVIGAL